MPRRERDQPLSPFAPGDGGDENDTIAQGFNALGNIVTKFSAKSLYALIGILMVLGYLSTSSQNFNWNPSEPTLSRHTHARLHQPKLTQKQLFAKMMQTENSFAATTTTKQPGLPTAGGVATPQTGSSQPPVVLTPDLQKQFNLQSDLGKKEQQQQQGRGFQVNYPMDNTKPRVDTVPPGSPGFEEPHIKNYAFPEKPFTGIYTSPADEAKVFVPPCPSMLSPPPDFEVPPLYCPGQFLPLFNFDNWDEPIPKRLQWLEQDVNMPVEKVREELDRDRKAHSFEGIKKVAAERAALNTFHTIEQFQTNITKHPLRHQPNTLDAIIPYRRLFDFIIINTELEWLDLRLQELWSVVDVFVIIECRETFSGKPKPLYYNIHKERYAHYQSKIFHVILDILDFQKDDPNAPAIRHAWDREHYQRQWPIEHGRLQRIFGVRPGDLLMVSDIDEFPRPNVLHQLKQCSGWEQMNKGKIALRADAHYYSWEFITHEVWTHPNLQVYDPNLVIDDHVMRWSSHADNAKKEDGPYVYKGSWHCTYCFSDLQQFVNKFESFSHQEYNNDNMKNVDDIRRKITQGVELFSPGQRPRVPLITKALPHVFVRNSKCYAHFLDRTIGIQPDRLNWWQE